MSRPAAAARGATLAEALAAVAVLGLGVTIALPSVGALRDGGRMAAGGREMAATLHAARWRAVASGRAQGLLFAHDERGWSWTEVQDGNGNGLRRDELAAGTDQVLGAPLRLEERVPGVRIGFPGEGPYPPPPGAGPITELADPVHFGSGDLLAFGPRGGASGGTLYLTDGRDGWVAVVLFGPTARVRVWKFDRRSSTWR